MTAETDAEEVRMLLAEAGYPHAVVKLDPSGGSPEIACRTTEGEVIVPDDVCARALTLWAQSHGMGQPPWTVWLVDDRGERVEVIVAAGASS